MTGPCARDCRDLRIGAQCPVCGHHGALHPGVNEALSRCAVCEVQAVVDNHSGVARVQQVWYAGHMTETPAKKPRRRRDNHEKKCGTGQYVSFIVRLLRKYGQVAHTPGMELDPDALQQLREIERALTEETEKVVSALRSQGWSWAQIGDAYGLDRSAAYRRWKHVEPAEGARLPGGQPGHLR